MPSCRLAVQLGAGEERLPRVGHVRVGEEVAEPGVAQVFVDAAADSADRRPRQRRPLAARAIGALREPAAPRHPPEEALVLEPAERQLQPDALVAAEKREEPVGGGGAHDLEPPLVLEAAEGPDEVGSLRAVAVAQPLHARPPEPDQCDQLVLAPAAEVALGLVAAGQPVGEEFLQLGGELAAMPADWPGPA